MRLAAATAGTCPEEEGREVTVHPPASRLLVLHVRVPPRCGADVLFSPNDLDVKCMGEARGEERAQCLWTCGLKQGVEETRALLAPPVSFISFLDYITTSCSV